MPENHIFVFEALYVWPWVLR